MPEDEQVPLRPAVQRPGQPAGRTSATGAREWRVQPVSAAWKGAAAGVFALVAVAFAADPTRMVVAGAAALLLAGLALRDVIAKVRLSADATGVTVVVRYSIRQHIPWSEIERIKVDSRLRFGVRSELLEIDTGDHLYFVSAAELSAPVAEVAEELARLRMGR